jgi:hypothetical protein
MKGSAKTCHNFISCKYFHFLLFYKNLKEKPTAVTFCETLVISYIFASLLNSTCSYRANSSFSSSSGNQGWRGNRCRCGRISNSSRSCVTTAHSNIISATVVEGFTLSAALALAEGGGLAAASLAAGAGPASRPRYAVIAVALGLFASSFFVGRSLAGLSAQADSSPDLKGTLYGMG